MKDFILKAAPLFALLLVATGTAARAAQDADADEHWLQTTGPITGMALDEHIRDWPELSRTAARAMVAKYGPPVRVGRKSLVWLLNSPWQRTVVYRNSPYHSRVDRDTDYLKQVITYRTPDDKIDDLRRFDRRLRVDTRTRELSFQSDSEKTNFLALNLADDIVNEKRSVEDARFFLRNTLRLEKSGKSSPYTEGLLFSLRDEPLDTQDWRIDPRGD